MYDFIDTKDKVCCLYNALLLLLKDVDVVSKVFLYYSGLCISFISDVWVFREEKSNEKRVDKNGIFCRKDGRYYNLECDIFAFQIELH